MHAAAVKEAAVREPGLAGNPAVTPFGRILVIDEDSEFCEVMSHAFGRCGFVIESCRQLEGVLLDDDSPPDVVIMELRDADRRSLARISSLRNRRSWADVPIICVSSHDQSLLRLCAFDAGADDFVLKPVSSDELVARVQVRLRQVRRIATLLAQSRVDELTGRLNRRGALEELDKALAWSRRSAEPCSLMLLDIDGLKSINDRLGHASGDALIRAVGAALQQGARCEDSVARLGGDEFVVVLPRADADGARRVVERVRERLAALSIPGVIEGARASIGVATSPSGELSAAAMLAIADEDMYAEKRSTKKGRARLRMVRDSDELGNQGE
jgi:two-component system, cell cycle response regulator